MQFTKRAAAITTIALALTGTAASVATANPGLNVPVTCEFQSTWTKKACTGSFVRRAAGIVRPSSQREPTAQIISAALNGLESSNCTGWALIAANARTNSACARTSQ